MATVEGHVIAKIAGHVVTEARAAIVPAAAVVADAMVAADAMGAADATVLVEAVPEETVQEEIAQEEIAHAAIARAARVPMLFQNVHGQSACAQGVHTEQLFLTRSR